MSQAERQARLNDVDSELASLREEVSQLQTETDEPGDPEDAGANLAAREELNTRIEDLEEERRQLTGTEQSPSS